MRHILGSLIIGLLLAPATSLASGVEARRAYIARNYETARHTAQAAAEQGDSIAMLVLGMLYFEGKGVTRDYLAALKWWRASADLGNSRAQNNIGIIYLNGLGIETNYDKATKWLRLSASANDAHAYRNLGSVYETGRGVSIDYKIALEMYEKAEKLYHKEFLEDPDNQETTRSSMAAVARSIDKLRTVLANSGPIPALSTPPSDSGQQITPK